MSLVRSLRAGSTGLGLLMVATIGAPARGQAPATPKAEAGRGEQPTAPVGEQWVKTVDLTNRYHFVERYPREDGRDQPGSLRPYRVGIVEVIREVVDQPQGAPRRSESTRQTVFVERTSEQGSLGGVVGSVRSIERFDLQPADPARTMAPAPLDGLTVGLRYRPTEWPLVLPLADRKPTDYEFEVLSRQMVVAQLGQLLPPQAVRLGDSWRISRRAAAALLGDPQVRGETLTGRFSELRREVAGARLAATIGVSGRTATSQGESAVNAEITFTCQAEAPAKLPFGTGSDRLAAGLLDAVGGVTEVRLGRSTTGPLPGPGRLQFQSTREVTMRRQLDIGDAGAALPKLPPPPKGEDPATWLTWIDAGKRFRLDHPQDFLPPERPALAPADVGSVTLVRSRRNAPDLIKFNFFAQALTPDDLKARLTAETNLMKLQVIRGEEGWLPEADWPNGKVYRMEAAVQVPDQGTGAGSRGTRIHFDAFLIQPPQAVGILAIATTPHEPVASFRREVEEILKTLQVDPAIPGGTR